LGGHGGKLKAAIYTKRDSGKCLELIDISPPSPKPGEVLIKTRAASVNPLDWRMKARRPGVDIAGEVVSVGRDVTRFSRGDAVFGAGKGSFAEYVCARESKLAVKPDKISFEEAACVPIAGLTARQGLRDKGKVARGQKVLINGAAGGVDAFAVQIAKVFGAEVTAVCSTKNLEIVRSLGADVLLDYGQQDFTSDTRHYDLLLDNVGNRTLSAFRRVLTPGGRCVLVGAPKQAGVGWLLLRVLKASALSQFRRQRFVFFIAQMKSEDLESLCTLIQNGSIRPIIDRRYTLTETGQALAYVQEGHARAKVIITPD
jgi:NADPH:quinone reductase-like Zn-dependent oxidoreductase